MQLHLRSIAVLAVVASTGCASAPMAQSLAKLPEAAPIEADAETYTLDGSNAHLDTDVTALATYTLHYVKLHGTLVINPKSYSVQSLKVEVDTHEVHATVELAATLGKSKFLQSDEYPTAGFSAQSNGPPSLTGGPMMFAGELRLHGVTKIVTIPATVKGDACELSFATAFSINRHDFHVETTGELESAVGDKVEIRVDAKVPRKGRPARCDKPRPR